MNNLDVVNATAEALPLELLNKTNKELTAQLSHMEQQLDEKTKGIEDQRKRLQFMSEHLSNVRAEIVNTQSLSESKRKEVESEESMLRLIDRECGRLTQKQKELKKEEEAVRDQMTALQNRIFQGNLKIEEFKATMDFNQEELEQWDEARRQKEDDEKAIAQYTKQDEVRMKELTRNVEKVEARVREKQKALENEIINTQNAQIELDRCATEYRKLHGDRSDLLDQWEAVVNNIASRDAEIQNTAQQYAEGVEWLRKREDVRRQLSENLEEVKRDTEIINEVIAEKEQTAQKYRDAVPALSQQVQEMIDENGALREEVARTSKDKKNLLNAVTTATEDIAKKKAQLEATIRRRADAKEHLEDEIECANDLQRQSALIAQLLKDALKTDENLERDIEKLKSTLFKENQSLHNIRDKQALILSGISGAQSQAKNMNAKIAQLDSESFSQQGVLYNIEFCVQQMEKKVNRARGERTEEERKELHEKIDLLQKTLDELEQQHRILDVQVKRVREELRQSKIEMGKMEKERQREEDAILEINLQCTHCDKDSARIEKEKEEKLIKLDTLELQLNRQKRLLQQQNDELMSMEEKKRQLEADVEEREAEIAVHHSLLKMEGKIAEEERKRLMNELLERQKDLTAIKNRYDVLVGKMDPAQARLSQAQLVVEAAKEREDLQYKGDSLDSRIKRMERDILKLEKTISILKASNNDYKHKFDKVTDDHEDVQTQRTLQSKHKELKSLMSRRALEVSDYQSTVQAKQYDLQEMAMEREHIQNTLRDLQQEYEVATQEILQTREATLRYEQAIDKVAKVVDAETRRDIELAESKERLENAVGRLLQSSQQAGDEVYDAVHRMIMESNLPINTN